MSEQFCPVTLEQFVEKLAPLLINPNGIASDGGVIYLYTKDHEMIAFSSVPSGLPTNPEL
jgi:hypothetical protein